MWIRLAILLLASILTCSGQNQILNSSFLKAWPRDHAYGDPDKFSTTEDDIVDGWQRFENAGDTDSSLVCPTWLRLRTNTFYTLSFTTTNVSYGRPFYCEIKNMNETEGGSYKFVFSPGVGGGQWRHAATFRSPQTQLTNSLWAIRWTGLQVGYPGNYTWIKEVQFEEGQGPSGYAPIVTNEVVAYQPSNTVGGINFIGSDVTNKLAILNSSATTNTVIADWEVRNFWNVQVDSGSITNTVEPGRMEDEFTITPTETGPYRLLIWNRDHPHVIDETTYTVLYEARSYAHPTNAVLGTHVPATNPTLMRQMELLSGKWMNRSLSTGREAGRIWEVMSGPGSYDWTAGDAWVSNTLYYGGAPLVMLKVSDDTGTMTANGASWLLPLGSSNFYYWCSNFAYQAASHYGTNVNWYELNNEPAGSGAEGALDYLQYAILATQMDQAIKAANPSAITVVWGGAAYSVGSGVGDVLGMSSATNYWITNGYTPGDIASCHVYHSTWYGSTNAWDRLRDNIYYPMGHTNFMNTETGLGDESFRWHVQYEPQNSYRNYSPGKDLQYQSASWSKNFIRSIGELCSKVFMYDYRGEASAYGLVIGYTPNEIDGALGPRGVIMAMQSKLLGGSVGVGGITNWPGVEAYHLMEGTNDIVCLWVEDTTNICQVSAADVNVVTAYDIFGVAKTLPVTFSYMPLYLIGATNGLIDSLSVVSTNDTAAPNLTIVEQPASTVSSNQFRFRFRAMDELCIPSIITGSNAMTVEYRWQLDDYETNFTSWSSSDRVAEYYDVPAGSYTFRVQARDLIGNETTTNTVGITVE